MGKHYYLIKTEEDCNVGNCGGTKDILELDCYTKDFVELTEEELRQIYHRSYLGGWDNPEWLDKIRKVLDNESN